MTGSTGRYGLSPLVGTIRPPIGVIHGAAEADGARQVAACATGKMGGLALGPMRLVGLFVLTVGGFVGLVVSGFAARRLLQKIIGPSKAERDRAAVVLVAVAVLAAVATVVPAFPILVVVPIGWALGAAV